MKFLVSCEIIAFLVSAPLLGLLYRRGAVTEKQMAFTMSTLFSLWIGSLYISLGNPQTLFSVPLKDWLVAIPLSLLIWVFSYALSRWLFRQFFQK